MFECIYANWNAHLSCDMIPREVNVPWMVFQDAIEEHDEGCVCLYECVIKAFIDQFLTKTQKLKNDEHIERVGTVPCVQKYSNLQQNLHILFIHN